MIVEVILKYSTDFFSEPKDNMCYESDAYACTHSSHILIPLILSLSLKCTVLFALSAPKHLTVHACIHFLQSFKQRRTQCKAQDQSPLHTSGFKKTLRACVLNLNHSFWSSMGWWWSDYWLLLMTDHFLIICRGINVGNPHCGVERHLVAHWCSLSIIDSC